MQAMWEFIGHSQHEYGFSFIHPTLQCIQFRRCTHTGHTLTIPCRWAQSELTSNTGMNANENLYRSFRCVHISTYIYAQLCGVKCSESWIIGSSRISQLILLNNYIDISYNEFSLILAHVATQYTVPVSYWERWCIFEHVYFFQFARCHGWRSVIHFYFFFRSRIVQGRCVLSANIKVEYNNVVWSSNDGTLYNDYMFVYFIFGVQSWPWFGYIFFS